MLQTNYTICEKKNQVKIAVIEYGYCKNKIKSLKSSKNRT